MADACKQEAETDLAATKAELAQADACKQEAVAALNKLTSKHNKLLAKHNKLLAKHNKLTLDLTEKWSKAIGSVLAMGSLGAGGDLLDNVQHELGKLQKKKKRAAAAAAADATDSDSDDSDVPIAARRGAKRAKPSFDD